MANSGESSVLVHPFIESTLNQYGSNQDVHDFMLRSFENVPEVPVKGDPEEVLAGLEGLREGCAIAYSSIDVPRVFSRLTDLILASYIGSMKSFVNSGSYRSLDIRGVVTSSLAKLCMHASYHYKPVPVE